MGAEALLERPVWHSLRTGWFPLAQGHAQACRLDPAYGPFAASASAQPADLAALHALVRPGEEVWLVEREGPAIPSGMNVLRRATLLQMVMGTLRPRARPIALVELGDADAAEMLALATLTKPGPFVRSTHRLGRFVGVREDGRLIAMAGERMRLPGLCEVSGVCTHPDYRGRGLAGALISVVAERMIARGDLPFLHSYAENKAAIALYESLGFRGRTEIQTAVITSV